MPESDEPSSAAEYARLQEAYGGKFIVTRGGEVVASGDTHVEMVRDLKEKGIEREGLLFEYVRPKGIICVY